jgi:uncharacterized integral membrane protein (TIGR00697 family)
MKSFFVSIGNFFRNGWRNFVSKYKGKGPLKASPLLTILIILATSAMLISNVIASKNMSLFGWQIGGQELTLTCGILVFPITYILSDVFSEVYGYRWSRITCWIAFGMNLLMVTIFEIASILPAVGWQQATGYSDAFSTVLGINFSGGMGPLGILIASLVAYVAGDFFNDIVFQSLKEKDKSLGKSKVAFATRAILSSLAGELVDSCIFLPTMYSLTGQWNNVTSVLVYLILIQAGLKTLYELCIVPLTTLVVKKARAYEDKRDSVSSLARYN